MTQRIPRFMASGSPDTPWKVEPSGAFGNPFTIFCNTRDE